MENCGINIMDIFYSFWENVSSDTIFTVITTTSIFLVGLKAQRLDKLRSLRIIDKQKKRYLLEKVKQFNESLSKQLKSLNTFYSKLNIENKIDEFSIVLIIRSSDLPKHYDYEYYNIFTSIPRPIFRSKSEENENRKVELFTNAMNKTSLIIADLELIDSDINFYTDGKKKFKSDYSDGLGEIMNIYDDDLRLCQVNNTMPDNDKFFYSFADIYAKWFTVTNNQHPKICTEKLIFPLRKLCLNYSKDIRAHVLVRHCNSCINAFQNLNYLIRVVKVQMKNHVRLYEEAIKIINNFLSENK